MPTHPASIMAKSVISLSGEFGNVLAITSPRLNPCFKSLAANNPADFSRLLAVKASREPWLTQMKISRSGYVSAKCFSLLGIVSKPSGFKLSIVDERLIERLHNRCVSLPPACVLTE